MELAVSEAADFGRIGPDALQPEFVARPAISVIGLGYVGAVSMACLSHLGFEMVGVDVDPTKVEAIQAGKSPIVERDLERLLGQGRRNHLISATTNLPAAVLTTEVTFISVGTPTAEDGSADLTYVRQAARAIGRAIAMKVGFHVVVLRCSVPPGTTLEVVAPEIEAASGKRLGEGFGLCFNPEFLREGVAVADFFEPPKTVVGANDPKSEAIVSEIYGAIDDNIIFTSIAAAEMVKYVDNVWHATKVTFANEIGRLCKSLGIDSHEVMNIFVRDTKLNLSPYYLKPGFAYGGSCLPKEVRAVAHLAAEREVEVPLIASLARSNREQVREAHRRIRALSPERVGFLGLTFKPGTDDIRESPTLELMAMLEADGIALEAYDPNLRPGPNLDSQIAYVRHAAPHLERLMARAGEFMTDDLEALVQSCDCLVVSHATDAFRKAVAGRPAGVHVLDLARLYDVPPEDAHYDGIAW